MTTWRCIATNNLSYLPLSDLNQLREHIFQIYIILNNSMMIYGQTDFDVRVYSKYVNNVAKFLTN